MKHLTISALALATAAFGYAQSQCGTRVIFPKTEVKLYHHLSGNPAPAAAAMRIDLGGRLLYTRGRIRIFGELGIGTPGADFFGSPGYSWDTFDRTLFDVATDAPGCVIRTVKNRFGSFESKLSYHKTGLPPGTVPLAGDIFGLLGPSVCTTWAPGVVQAGNVGCNIQFGAVTVELAPASELPCTADDVNFESLYPTQPFDIPLYRQSGDAAIHNANISVDVRGALTWTENRVEIENTATIRELQNDRSVYRGTKSYTLFDVSRDAPGCRMTSVSAPYQQFRAYDSYVSAVINTPSFQGHNVLLTQNQPYSSGIVIAECNTVNYESCKVMWSGLNFTAYLAPLGSQ